MPKLSFAGRTYNAGDYDNNYYITSVRIEGLSFIDFVDVWVEIDTDPHKTASLILVCFSGDSYIGQITNTDGEFTYQVHTRHKDTDLQAISIRDLKEVYNIWDEIFEFAKPKLTSKFS